MTKIRVSLWALALAAPLAAQNPPPPPPREPPAPLQRPELMGRAMEFGAYGPEPLVDRREALSLTPEQVSRLEALAQDARQAREKATADAKPHWDQLEDLWKQPAPDVNQVRTHAQAAMQAMQAARLAQLTAAAQAKAVLTPEQRGRVAGWADGARFRMRDRMEGPRMRMRGPMRMRMRPPR